AEDGIRDFHVTGVQTCALPIWPTDELRRELNARARAAGLLAPHVERRLGGLGLGHVGRAIVFEEAGYSMLGPIALHCAAPDEGKIGRASCRERVESAACAVSRG